MNKRIAVLLAAVSLFAVPAAASDIAIRNIDFSIGIRAGQPYQHRQPEVVYVYGDRDHRGRHYRDDKDRDHRGRHHRHWREKERVIVVDRSRRCEPERVVVTRPGTVVVVADGRRW
jgi:hypothetical protein